ncbi:MAG: HD-GYP domain-containing protein [Sarcina sp.]
MRLIPLECVKEKQTMPSTVYNTNGRILLRKGIELNDSLIKNLSLHSLYVKDEYSINEIPDVISPALRNKSVTLVKDIFENAEMLKLANVDFNSLSNKESATIVKKKEAYLDTVQDLSEDLCQSILANKDISGGLVDIKRMDTYTYQHSVNVATLSVIIGIAIGLSKDLLVDLCVGALLHDIGKVFISDEIIQKPGKLTDEEFNTIKSHPKLGYDYIKNIPTLKTRCKMVVLQHHEKMNGAGYPNALFKDDISILARIVSIADVYDALTSDRPYKRAMCPNDAFEFILSNAGTMFDFQLTKIFSRIIVPYPEGTLVKLSNDSIAVVKRTNPLYPLRPYVQVIKAEDDSIINSNIDLATSLSIVIQAIEYVV